MKILLVEDNRGDALLFSRAMRRAQAQVEIVRSESAEQALVILRTVDPAPINLIVLDINLPGISGTQLLEIIKADRKLRRIPAVILSSSSAPEDIDACYDRFANGYLTKPIESGGYEAMARCFYSCWLRLMELPNPLGSEKVLRLS